MKFFGNGVVWDAENDRRLMKFADGVFETNDAYITEKLIKGGYEHDEEPVIEITHSDGNTEIIAAVKKEPKKELPKPVKKKVGA